VVRQIARWRLMLALTRRRTLSAFPDRRKSSAAVPWHRRRRCDLVSGGLGCRTPCVHACMTARSAFPPSSKCRTVTLGNLTSVGVASCQRCRLVVSMAYLVWGWKRGGW